MGEIDAATIMCCHVAHQATPAFIRLHLHLRFRGEQTAATCIRSTVRPIGCRPTASLSVATA